MSASEYDVIIVGGGITGMGTARDCAMRGLKVLLIERNDIATGATGRNHGLLHSGARYAVNDAESAAECIRENLILKNIARHCVDDTSGLFLTLPEDDLSYQDTFVKACRNAGIDAQVIDPKQALAMEPSANPDIIGAVQVPDGSVDPFRLCASNMIDAKLHGARILVYTQVKSFIIEQGAVKGVLTVDRLTGVTRKYYAPVTVNAAGIWGHDIAALAGVNITMFPAKGSLLVYAHRVNSVVLNRCRKPANADILVPGDTVCVIGTTSTRVPYEECDDIQVTSDEVDLLMREGSLLAPCLEHTRILRAYAGVRPLVSEGDDPSGRNISRGIVCLDHQKRDGLGGFVTITGGKLMTYRLMAEKATDEVCRKLGRSDLTCSTANTPLPGSSEGGLKEVSSRIWGVPNIVQKAVVGRIGDRASKIHIDDAYQGSLVCECEEVPVSEIDAAISNQNVTGLLDLRRRTRIGMGTCQGELCACRAAGRLAQANGCAAKAKDDLRSFLDERWKGMRPVAWGETMRESAYTQWVYSEVLGIYEE